MEIFIDHQPSSRIVSSAGDLIRDNYADSIATGIDLPRRAVAVICVGGEAVAIGAFRRSIQITSFARRYEISSIALLSQRVQLARAVDKLLPQVKAYFSPALSNKTALPEGTSAEFTRVLSSLADNSAELIERCSGEVRTVTQASQARRNLLAEEKDAFGLIAELAGLGRDPKAPGRRLIVPPDPVDPDRTFLETVRLGYGDDLEAQSDEIEGNDEDALVVADMERFDGLLGKRARKNARGMIIPHKRGTITVMNTNKWKLEHTLGCDLIYYHANRHCALLVQYKRMIEEGNRWVYRGDNQLTKELERMRKLKPDPYPSDVAQYRLNSGPHYLKVIRPTDYDGQSAELMKGLYIPLGLVDLMLGSEDDITRHGNLRITWDDEHFPTQRYLNNTLFTQLYRDGWIGSCATTSDYVRSLIDRLFDADELVTIAIAEGNQSRG